MKNKNKTYLLLTIVFGVWGIIGYKIWSGFKPDLPKMSSNDFGATFKPKQMVSIDTFSIQMVNRDPFLGTLTIPKKRRVAPKTKKKPPIVWPPIIYQGIITNQNSKQQLFVITINGEQQLLTKGQVFNEIKLVEGIAKHIIVSYKKEQKKIIVQE
ncbi:hypothetical protein [Pontimicrobium sp. SW4]|uniref:Type II secretion system protein GspC N-terminal domain-containing protein n=1 Tax=Pontimicrobium sp. SW4 TaxID=3153519 RepID=A0AAU7BQA9_9FLAO